MRIDPACAAPLSKEMYYVYLLRCKDESIYVGHAEDVQKRLSQHMAGQVAWTKTRKPLSVVHMESFPTRAEAIKREKVLKSGYGRTWIRRRFKRGAARQAGAGKREIINTARLKP